MFSWSRWIDKPQNILLVSMMWTILWKLFCLWLRNFKGLHAALLKSSFDKQAAWYGVFVQKVSVEGIANGQDSRFVYVRFFMLNTIKERFRSSSHWDLSVRRSINDNYWSTISHNLTDRPPNNLSPCYAMINGRLNEISLVIFHYSP